MSDKPSGTVSGFKMEAIDVFETSDLPEVDQHMFSSADSDPHDNVEILPITTNEAFGRFKGSYIDSKTVDFSEKLRKERRQGYTVVWTGEPDRAEQTPLKKYKRINCEVRELMDDIKNCKSAAPEEGLDKVSVELEKLHQLLVQMRLEDVTGDQTKTLQAGGDPSAAKLLQQLSAFKASGVREDDKDKSKKEVSNQASYSLYMKGSTATKDHSSSLSSLSARIAALETAVGFTPDQLSILTMETGKKNLTGALQVLSSKTAMMDPGKLDHIEGRLGALQQKFGTVQENKSSLDSDRLNKLDEMIVAGERTKPLYDSIPDTIARLESLQELHMEAGEFSNSLLQLDSLQTQLSLQLANNLSLLQQTKKKFENNKTNIYQNFESLFQRIEKIQKMKK